VFTDRDFYRSVLAGALESFGSSTLAVILNVPAAELSRWAQGRTRPPAALVLQVIDLMWPKSRRARVDHAGPTRVLMAVSPFARDMLARLLERYPVEFACSLDEGALALRRTAYSHVIVGYLFADSHMFEFAQRALEEQPSARVLCVKAAGRALDDDVRSGLHAAARELGCEGFFDLTGGDPRESFDRAFEQLLGHFRAIGRDIEPALPQLRHAVKGLRSL
jgi:hypothetical protein